ncbi:hypothetical protein [Geodermatophilus sp. SYSU D01119]
MEEAGRALFDEVWERDADGVARPDLAADGPAATAPVVAVAFTPPQAGYGDRRRAGGLREEIEEWFADRQLPWSELGMDVYEKPHPGAPRRSRR